MLGQLRTRLKDEYDLVLVDTPPVLVLDEACRLNPLIDGAVIVVRWGQTTEEVLSDAAERLSRNGVPIAGTVINDVDLRKQRAYGYSGYAYNYSYGKAARG